MKIRPDASAPLISYMHTPSSPNGMSSYAVTNGCSLGGGVGTDAVTTSFSCSTSATNSVTLNDFTAIDQSTGTWRDWTWRMSAVEGNPYNAPQDLVNPYTGYLRNLPALAKSTLMPHFQIVYRADSQYTGAVPVTLQYSQTLRDTYVEWHFFWSDVFWSSRTNTRWATTTVDFGAVGIHEFTAPLIARHSGLAMDVYYSSTALETPVIQWTPTGGLNQSFQFVRTADDDGHYFIKPRHSGLCLDVHYSSLDPGADIVQWTCTSAPNQRFQLVDAGGGYHYVKVKHSGQCLSIANGSADPLAAVVQMPCTGADNQRFRMNN
ncbi:RICIN domain-containing protein [Sorangium sp. So ce1335]|uniref:RICIN domain-containing protein n=1 Tax=Sorangium sp. So ce1335 TaxID=3133335 RepID=UPI003F62FAAB